MIKIKVDASSALRGLDDAAHRQAPFALSLMLNRLANDGQKAEQERISSAFRLRRETFNLRGIYISKQDRATKTKLTVVIQVEQKRSYLEKFEEGGEKVPVGGRKFLAVPNREVFGRKILKADDPLRPKNLHLHKDEHGRIIGDNRTFMIFPNSAPGLILMRTGTKGFKGFKTRSMERLTLQNFGPERPWKRLEKRKRRYEERETVVLYRLVRQVRVKASLQFVETITREVQAKTAARFEEAFMQATRTAR